MCKNDMDWMTVAKYGFTFISGGCAGALINQLCTSYRNRLQKMKCYYIEDDVQSKLPVQIDRKQYENVCLKKFRVTNTTNRDIEKFAVRFVFDLKATIIDYSSHTKGGDSQSSIRIDAIRKNECKVYVEDFNRGDKLLVNLRVANVTDNSYYVTELGSTGFKVICKDKRKRLQRTKSLFSEALS